MTCGAVAAMEVGRRRAARRRAAALGFAENRAAGVWNRLRGRSVLKARISGHLPVVGAGLAAFILLGGVVGCAAGLAAAYGARRWQRRPRDGEEVPCAAEVERQLPLAADLLAACLAAGAGPGTAAEAVGSSLGGPVGDRLVQAAAEVRLGGEPSVAWGRVGALPGAYGMARALERAQATGVPGVRPMARLAGELRAAHGRAAGIRARRAGVLATAPLGLCFLPAFLMVGVVPVVIGLAAGLSSGG
ncbi:type II secretion system F family protein [Streptomyces sp. NPDC057654]|uniref:type II secretion system F family protein n=1 Tax=Streptomyces sp. NPDC057654 TaxID=3346196 RepID=UPI0036C3C8C3